MNLLLDSHTILWAILAPEKLSAQGKRILSENENEIFVSHVSFWEISMKYALKKLDLNKLSPEDFPNECLRHGFNLIELTAYDASTFHRLPIALHKDPFDRMLAWQAITRQFFFLSKDESIRAYEQFGLRVIW